MDSFRVPGRQSRISDQPFAVKGKHAGRLVTAGGPISVRPAFQVRSFHFPGRAFPRRNPESSNQPESLRSILVHSYQGTITKDEKGTTSSVCRLLGQVKPFGSPNGTFSLYVDLCGVKGWRFLPQEIHAVPELLEARIASTREYVILHLPGENIVV